MVLGACSGLFDDDAYTPAEKTGGEGGEDMVEVRVQLKGDDRSVSDVMLEQAYLNYYEVIFKNNDRVGEEKDYYIGTAKAGEDYLTVSVPATTAGKYYDILLLGGRYENRLLLVTAFVNSINEKTKATEYSENGTGVPIIAGTSNLITLQRHKVNLELNETNYNASEEVSFMYNGSGVPITRSTEDKIATLKLTKGETNPSGVDLVMKIETAKFADLIYAAGGDATFNTTSFASTEVVLYPLYNQPFAPAIATGALEVADDTLTYTHTFNSLTADFSDKDVDAGLRYNFLYYAFGDSASGSSKWEIRNGVNNRLLDNGEVGGLIRVRVGEGSTGPTNIEFNINP
jgi:hypothetical protein